MASRHHRDHQVTGRGRASRKTGHLGLERALARVAGQFADALYLAVSGNVYRMRSRTCRLSAPKGTARPRHRRSRPRRAGRARLAELPGLGADGAQAGRTALTYPRAGRLLRRRRRHLRTRHRRGSALRLRSSASRIRVSHHPSRDSGAVAIAVSRLLHTAPIQRDTPPGSEQGRGLNIVEALSATGAGAGNGGKAVSQYWPERHDRSWPTSPTCRCSTTSTPTPPQYVKLAGSSATRSSPASTAGATACQPPSSPASTRCPCGSMPRTRDARGEPVRQPPEGLHSYSVIWQAGDVMSGRFRRVDEDPTDQAAVVGANIPIDRRTTAGTRQSSVN